MTHLSPRWRLKTRQNVKIEELWRPLAPKPYTSYKKLIGSPQVLDYNVEWTVSFEGTSIRMSWPNLVKIRCWEQSKLIDLVGLYTIQKPAWLVRTANFLSLGRSRPKFPERRPPWPVYQIWPGSVGVCRSRSYSRKIDFSTSKVITMYRLLYSNSKPAKCHCRTGLMPVRCTRAGPYCHVDLINSLDKACGSRSPLRLTLLLHMILLSERRWSFGGEEEKLLWGLFSAVLCTSWLLYTMLCTHNHFLQTGCRQAIRFTFNNLCVFLSFLSRISILTSVARYWYRNSVCLSVCPTVCPLRSSILWKRLKYCHSFCRAMICISAAYAAMRCLSVRPSVRLSRSWIMSKRTIFEFFSPPGSHIIIVFPYQRGWRYSDGTPPPNGSVECRWDRQKRESGRISGCIGHFVYWCYIYLPLNADWSISWSFPY